MTPSERRQAARGGGLGGWRLLRAGAAGLFPFKVGVDELSQRRLSNNVALADQHAFESAVLDVLTQPLGTALRDLASVNQREQPVFLHHPNVPEAPVQSLARNLLACTHTLWYYLGTFQESEGGKGPPYRRSVTSGGSTQPIGRLEML